MKDFSIKSILTAVNTARRYKAWLAPALEKVETQLFESMSHLANPLLSEKKVLPPIENSPTALGQTAQVIKIRRKTQTL